MNEKTQHAPASRRPSSRRGASGCSSTSRAERLTGYVLFDADYIQYFTSFNFLATERPVVVAQSAAGELAVFVPEFEVERVRAETAFERVESYPEYPGIEHPMRDPRARARGHGHRRRDRRRPRRLPRHPRLPGAVAERGRRRARVAPLGAVIESMMVRKSAPRSS